MFDRFFGSDLTPELTGQSVRLHAPRRKDYEAWAKLRDDSANFLRPWEPTWTFDETSRSAFTERRQRARQDAKAGTGFVFLIFERQTDQLAGGITLGSIRYGVARSGQIGYWMGQAYAGKGYMQDAVKTLSRFAFERLALHRLEAACIPSNERSIQVLQKSGFTQEGLLKSYLKINGIWQDHLLFSRISGVTD
jgi:ribosomal-protein-alanine N-acetyltransferase